MNFASRLRFRYSLPTNELAIGLVFFTLAVLAIVFTREPGHLSLIWPADAVAAALLIRLQSVRWPWACASIFVAATAASMLAAHDSFGFAAALSLVDTTEVIALFAVVRVGTHYQFPDISTRQGTQLTFLFGFAVPAAFAFIGGLVGYAGLQVPALRVAQQWWLSEAVGASLFAPPIFLYSTASLQRLVSARFRVQNAVTLLLCLLTCFVAVRFVKFPFGVFGVPLLIAAFRVGGLGTALLSLTSGLTFVTLWLCGIRPSGLEPLLSVSLLTSLPIVALLATVLTPIAVGLGTDDRRKTARALRFNERRFRESMERLPIGMLLMSLDGRWEYTNTALQRMLGYSAQECSEFTSSGPSEANDLYEIEERRRQLQSGELEFYDVERRFRHKQGAWIWAHATVSLVKDEAGRAQHFSIQIESLEARRCAEIKLAEERERLRATLRAITDAVITTDASSRITYLNAAAEAMLGQTLSAVANQRLDDVISLTDPKTSLRAANLIGKSVIHGVPFRRESPCILHRPDGSACYVSEVVSPVLDANSAVTGTVIVLRDSTKEYDRQRDLNYQATHDVLTGLTNRFEFDRSLAEAFERAKHLGTSAALLAFDLDRFKSVNDVGGHAAGDAVLRGVAACLRSTFRQSDTIARLGGDEFAVILMDCPEERGQAIARELLVALNPLATEWEGTWHEIGASVGLAMLQAEYQTAAAWLTAADRACYLVKSEGRGQLRTAVHATSAASLKAAVHR